MLAYYSVVAVVVLAIGVKNCTYPLISDLVGVSSVFSSRGVSQRH